MDRALVDRIARTVLYEGYVLYPYRPSSLKNTKRCGFGILYPEPWVSAQTGSDRSQFQMECLLEASDCTRIRVLVRFLQFVPDSGRPREQGIEREVSFDAAVSEIATSPMQRAFSFGEPYTGVEGVVELEATPAEPGISKLKLVVRNATDCQSLDADEALKHSLASAHAVVAVAPGRFFSVTDPPERVAAAAAKCSNRGVWPVLVGMAGATDTILASPIILPDYPEVAPESPGDLFDATEIDEILTLRLLTLTDKEKAEVRASEERARDILNRAETLPAEHLMRLHGTIRGLAAATGDPFSAWDTLVNSGPADTVRVSGIDLARGDRVRLHPRKRADIFDSALEGRIATICAIEQDFEDNVHVAVVVDDDPGRDLGEQRQIGHRFFFSPSEVEPLQENAGSKGAVS